METVNQNLAWFALQVRVRYERSVATLLEGKTYEPFLPSYRSTRRWSDRVKQVELPLFPGYLFCRFNPQNRLPILITPGVLRVVGIANSPEAIDDAEIRAIQTIVQSVLPYHPWPYLHVGDQVRIRSGPLTGLEGILTAFKGQRRLIVSVSILRRSVAVELDGASVSVTASSSHPLGIASIWSPAWKPVTA